MTPAQVQAKVLREKLGALRERANAATPGPWRLSSMGYSVVSDLHTEHDGDYCSTICSVHCGVRTTEKALKQFQDDGYFIGHSRTDIPALLDVVESLLKKLESIHAEATNLYNKDAAEFIKAPADKPQSWDAPSRHLQTFGWLRGTVDAAISQAAERLNEGRESK